MNLQTKLIIIVKYNVIYSVQSSKASHLRAAWCRLVLDDDDPDRTSFTGFLTESSFVLDRVITGLIRLLFPFLDFSSPEFSISYELSSNTVKIVSFCCHMTFGQEKVCRVANVLFAKLFRS